MISCNWIRVVDDDDHDKKNYFKLNNTAAQLKHLLSNNDTYTHSQIVVSIASSLHFQLISTKLMHRQLLLPDLTEQYCGSNKSEECNAMQCV